MHRAAPAGFGTGEKSLAVGLTVPCPHLRVRLTDDVVLRTRVEVVELGHRVDGPLDAFPLTQQPPREDGGWLAGRARLAVQLRNGNIGAVRDDGDAGRVDAVVLEQAVPGRPGHGDHCAGGGDQDFQDPTLVGRRRDQHSVQHRDQRDLQPLYDLEDVLAVGPGEDAVLVLQHDDVEAVESSSGLPRTTGVSAHPRRVGRLTLAAWSGSSSWSVGQLLGIGDSDDADEVR